MKNKLAKDYILANDTVIKPDGTIIKKDGTQIKLKEGEAVDSKGNLLFSRRRTARGSSKSKKGH